MGIYTDGAMIIGAKAEDVIKKNEYDPEGEYSFFYDWIEDHDLDYLSPYYDSDSEKWTIGYVIADVEVDSINEDWLDMVRKLAKEFETLTGVKAKLIGTQNVT